jgi:hypothetical protein
MIEVYFSSKIYSMANKLIAIASEKLIHSESYPKHYANLEIGMVTLLKPNENYPMHGDGKGCINIVTFLNNNGGMRFKNLDVTAFKGLSIKFNTEILHQPYTTTKSRWALLQRQ